MSNIATWYRINLQILSWLLPESGISYDRAACTWVRINRFPLPTCFDQKTSCLLLELPGIHAPITMPPTSIFLDPDLTLNSGHPFQAAGADYSSPGRVRFTLYLPSWNPTYDVVSGDNLASLLKTIYDNLKTER